jgi:glycosyltransferase involved in cell wall biosynthesis
VGCDGRSYAIVVVLIDEKHSKVLVRLSVERSEQPLELGDTADGRDDEVESHGLTLTPVPLVSVLLSVRNDARFVGEAAASILAQTLPDLELIVVDDASTDETPRVLAALEDGRVVVLRNDEQLGLAASLNRGLDHATGKYVARLDADDVSLPHRLERQVARIRAEPRVAVLGTAVTDLDEHGRPGRTHVMPAGARPLRWHALFSSPFFHPTVLVDRELVEAHGLRYDHEFLESEDYDLWTRLLAYAEGDNLREPLVRKRVHESQASLARSDLQESFRRRVALREIRRIAPGVDAERAWRVGARKQHERGSSREFVRLLAAFEREHGRSRAVRAAALRALVGSRRSRR